MGGETGKAGTQYERRKGSGGKGYPMSPHTPGQWDSPELPPIPAHELSPDRSVPPRPTPLRALPAGAWFARLLEHLPNPYIHAHASELAQLRADGATPCEAAIYARAYLLAPRLLTADEERHALQLAPPLAPLPRALLDDLGLLD